ncbi:hypothetical protein ABPG73_010943 [Tetrahymena malaccensis]
MIEIQESKQHLHINQQLFLRERETEDAFKLRQKNMLDDISLWTDSSKNSANFKVDLQNSQNMSKSTNIFKFNQNTQSIQLENSNLQNEEDISQYKEAKLNCGAIVLSKKNNFYGTQSILKQKLTSPIKNYNMNESKMDMSQSTTNNKPHSLKNVRQHQLSQNGISAKVLSNHIKLTMKLKQKFSYLFKAFTMKGRSKALNSTIRSCINDKSDMPGQNSRINAFLKSYYLIQIIIRVIKKLNITCIDCQSNKGVIISFLFITFNCFFLFQQSFYIVFQGLHEFHVIFCQVYSFLWIIEIVLKLNTSIYINSRLLVERQEIAFYYIKSKLIFDLLPLIIVIYDAQNTLVNIIIFSKIINIISELNKFYKFLFRIVRQYYLILLINLIIKMFLIAHVLACIWYLLALYEYNEDLEQNSWIKNPEIENIWWKLYFQALYWALTLMTTGSNEATTNLQRIFTCIIMIFTTIAFGYLLNVVGFILETIDEKNEKKRRDINILNEFMRSKNISQSLQAKINLNLENYYDMNFNKVHKKSQQVLDKISAELKHSLMKEYNRKLINKITFLTQNFSQETLDKLSLVAKEECYLPNQVICNLSQSHETALIYIISGQAEIQRTNRDQSYLDLSNLKVNQGEIIDPTNFFTYLSQPFQAISTQFTQILKISTSDMIQIIKENEKDFQIFHQIKDQIQYYQQISVIGLKCKFCSQSTHYIYDCPFLHFGKQIIYSKIGLQEKQEQSRQNCERRIKYMNTLIIQSTDPDLMQFQENHQIDKHIQSLTSIGVTVLLNDEVATNPENDDKLNEDILQQKLDFSIIEEDDEIQIDYSPCNRELYQQQSSILSNNLLNSKKTQRVSSFSQYIEDQEVASPVKNQLNDTQAKNIRESYKQLKINTHQRFNSLQDSSKEVRNSEQEVNHNVQKKSLFSQINSDIFNKQQSTSSINEVEDFKQKYHKKREIMKYPVHLNRKLLVPLFYQFLKQQYDQLSNNEQEFVKFNPWEFDKLKDWSYYFKYGNSKYNLLKYNKYQQMKIKQTLRKSPNKRVKNDD